MFRPFSTSGIGVEGNATASSGIPHSVTGKSSSPDGFGVYTPDDAKVDGGTFTAEEWQALVDGERPLLLDAVSAGNVVAGHASSSTAASVVGATIFGGRFDDGTTA